MVDQKTVRLVIFLAVLTERCRDSLALLARICEDQALFAPCMLEDIPAARVRRIWCFVCRLAARRQDLRCRFFLYSTQV